MNAELIQGIKNDLGLFSLYFNRPWFRVNNHHAKIIHHLHLLELGKIDRLMIFMPPRHGKSQLASCDFPAWYLGRNPNQNIIATSYSADLASDFGRKVRSLMSEPDYQNIFGVSLRKDAQAVTRFENEKGGVYVGAGVGGPITGRGSHLGIIDDPVKNREEAESERIRDRNYDWYSSTFFTRLAPNVKLLMMLTRWHDDDLAGRILAKG